MKLQLFRILQRAARLPELGLEKNGTAGFEMSSDQVKILLQTGRTARIADFR